MYLSAYPCHCDKINKRHTQWSHYLLLAAKMVYSCHSTTAVRVSAVIGSLLVGLDVVDKPIGRRIMSSCWSSSPQLGLNYLGQLLAQFNPVTIKVKHQDG